MNVIDILDRLPFELAARLESDPFFADIPVIVAVKGNISRQLEVKQAVITEKLGRRGVAVIVLQVVADDVYEGVPAAPMKLRPSFQVMENVELNYDGQGTKKSARKISRQIVQNMKIASLQGLVQSLKCARPAIEPVNAADLADTMVCEQVNFECLEFSDQQINFCLPPVLAQVGTTNTFTLATGTGGAAIWFTVDGSYPYPGDQDSFPGSTSVQYTDAIALTPGTPVQVRACAYLDGYIPSSVTSQTVLAVATTN